MVITSNVTVAAILRMNTGRKWVVLENAQGDQIDWVVTKETDVSSLKVGNQARLFITDTVRQEDRNDYEIERNDYEIERATA